MGVVCCTVLPAADKPDTMDIQLGMSTALTGPTQEIGLKMRFGVEAALEEVNRNGGIAGRKLHLIALDDGYEPLRAATNVRKLISENHVLAVTGNVGTPTAVAAVPIVNEGHTPLVGAFTGAGLLRKTPPDRYIINFRASYAEETGAMVDALIDKLHLKPEEIGFFTQRDAYGEAGFKGGLEALKRHGLTDESKIVQVGYERNTVAIRRGLSQLLLTEIQPKAVIMVGTYKPCGELLKQAHANNYWPLFLAVSFVGANDLVAEAGKNSEDTIITQVVPSFVADSAVSKRYQSAIHALNSEATPGYVSFEGYLVGRMLCLALEQAKAVDSESLVTAFENLGEFDLGFDTKLHLSGSEHQASHEIWPTVVKDGKVVSFDWNDLQALSDHGGMLRGK